MRREAFVVAAVCLLGLGCGNGNTNTTPPPTPSSTADVPSASVPPSASAMSSAPVPSASVAVDPPPHQDDSMCGGADIDLNAVLADRRCHTPRDAIAAPPNAVSSLKLTLTPSAPKVAPGGHVDLTLEIANTSQTPIPLFFAGDLTLVPQVSDGKNTRISPPAGDAPKNPDPKCLNEAECRMPTSHILIAPGGKAHAKVGWDASKVAWPKTGPTTCCTYHVDPVASGPIAAGTYKVKVPLPYETNQGNAPDPEITVRVGK